MKRLIALMLSLVLAFGLCACANTYENAEGTAPVGEEQQPVAIDNMGRTTTYDNAPETAVALSYSIAEIMVALGLEDKIVAVAPSMYILDQVSETYRDIVGSFPLLDGSYGVPTLETVLDTNAEFVFGDSYSFYASSVGTAEDFDAAGVKIYATEGTYVEDSNLENVYNDIINIGSIFRVEARAEALVGQLREREQKIKDKVSGLGGVSVFYFDSDTGGGVDMSTIGNIGLQNYIVTLAGGENIFNDEASQFFITSWEEVIARDPQYIIVCDYYGEGYAEGKISEMKSNPETAEMDAVKNDRFVIVPGLAMFPSLENLDVIEQIADALHP